MSNKFRTLHTCHRRSRRKISWSQCFFYKWAEKLNTKNQNKSKFEIENVIFCF